ncbi:macrophage colony-stimulating factor 1b isoform X4 [Acipenser ruthenus]|uniref:macrophage colony-stimulating factor 1b isoform X4 n=1 Tax=Acipenser ruthenus TaxID=7906 RepID=UPI00145AC597|nr:macrophage colony-stimulating factor 1b isoform X4 [Acipenser ruthenus]
MNTQKAAHALYKAKARQLCFLVLLCFHLASGDGSGSCRHSVTKDHIQTVNTLIVNQLENGFSIDYTFIDQGSLSKTCYVKAAFPKVLDVLTKHFNYHKSSVNFKYVDQLKTLVKNIYRTKCIPEVNVSVEDDPEKFVKTYAGSPQAVLDHIGKVMSFYMELLTQNRPINWNCVDQYAQDVAEPTTEGALSTGTTVCRCSCPTTGGGAAQWASTTATNLWKNLPNPTVDIQNTPYSTKLSQPQTGSPSTRERWGIPSTNPGTTGSHRQRMIGTDTTSEASTSSWNKITNNFQTSSSKKNPSSPSFTSIPYPQDEDNTGSPASEYTPTSSEVQGYGSKILGHGEGEVQPSDGPRGGRQSEKEPQKETQEDENHYKLAFILVTVCGVLLGILALYCFIQKKKLEAKLHKPEQSEDERLKQHSHHIEMEESTFLNRPSGSAL